MREMNVSQSHKGVNDMLAAVFILQGYLDSLRNEKKEENQSK
jgi:RNase H-fold protein (predicted Holliday junction resolvase)